MCVFKRKNNTPKFHTKEEKQKVSKKNVLQRRKVIKALASKPFLSFIRDQFKKQKSTLLERLKKVIQVRQF